MPGPLTQSPFSPQFWSGLRGGLRRQVLDPIVQDVRQGHRTLNEHYPLPYQAAQVANPVVGIAAAGLDYADNMQQRNPVDSSISAVSAVPVPEAAYGNVGTGVARNVAEAATSHPIPNAGGLARAMPGVFGTMYKAAAGVNTALLGKAGYDQFDPEQVARRKRPPQP